MYAIPQPFLDKMANLLGDDYDKFAHSLSQEAINGLRVNTLKIAQQQLIDRMPYPLVPIPWCKSGFFIDNHNLVPTPPSPGKHPYHYAGLYYLHEPSAMIGAEVLAPLPGEKVLDIAAAPGGKSTHTAALMNNTGVLVSNEIHSKRVWDLSENIERSGVTNAIITNETPQNLANYLGEYFDRVLVDAPCSGEGMFRKSETARKEWNIDLPKGCAIRQLGILDNSARLVKPGGCIVYTTCTFSPEENEGVIARFIETHPEFEIKSINCVLGFDHGHPEWVNLPLSHEIKHTVRIWPHQSNAEGHYCALLVKTHSVTAQTTNSQTNQKNNRNRNSQTKNKTFATTLLKKFVDENLSYEFDEEKILLAGNYLYQLPKNSPNLMEINVIHPGWWLGSIAQERFIPSHALAMGIQAGQFKRKFNLDLGDTLINRYLHGESISAEGEAGWILITIDGFPVGWGKRVNNVIKNHYPLGLRH